MKQAAVLERPTCKRLASSQQETEVLRPKACKELNSANSLMNLEVDLPQLSLEIRPHHRATP